MVWPTGQEGNARVTITVDDRGNSGSGDPRSATKSFSVTIKNTAPTPPQVSLVHTLAAGVSTLNVPFSSGLVQGHRDADLDAVTVELADAPPSSAGTLVLNPVGSFTFTRANSIPRVVQFTVRYTDGFKKSDKVLVTLILQ
jgi:hypothetical protein